jgi:hypothetical protein
VSFRHSSTRLMRVAEYLKFCQVEDSGVFPSTILCRYSGLTPHLHLLNNKHPTQPRAASDDEATYFSLLQCLDPISGSAHRCGPPPPHTTVRALIQFSLTFCSAPREEPCSLTQASVFPLMHTAAPLRRFIICRFASCLAWSSCCRRGLLLRENPARPLHRFIRRFRPFS